MGDPEDPDIQSNPLQIDEDDPRLQGGQLPQKGTDDEYEEDGPNFHAVSRKVSKSEKVDAAGYSAAYGAPEGERDSDSLMPKGDAKKKAPLNSQKRVGDLRILDGDTCGNK